MFPVMPTGYSFFAFIAISYLMDIQRRKVPAEKNPLKIFNYLFYFPRYISGPLARWKNFDEDVQRESQPLSARVKGLDRFILGLGKKVLIADVIGEWFNFGIFRQDIPRVTTGTAWVMLLFFAIQLYYDFSGYTDMAIGLSQLFGIKLPENFNLPYTASSITDFWRRWHISLSNWFREYVFMPLEWQRRKKKWLKQWMNTLIIFFLTGLWHGLSINFVIWGLMHGGMIVLENDKKIGPKIKGLRKPWQHVYTLGVVLVSWVFFRAPSFNYALHWLKALLGFGESVNRVGFSILPTIGSTVWLAFFLGVILATGLLPKVWGRLLALQPDLYDKGAVWAERFLYIAIFIVCIMMMTTTAVLPVIYGGF
jgi:alginate O-acetyltransferase complex protein AlgI